MEWKASEKLVPYEDALTFMDARVEGIHKGKEDECIWLLEHPPLYTAGTSAKDADLLNPRFPVFKTGRGGQYTYHGPAQRVAYVMIDLKKRGQPDVKKYVCNLEYWITKSLECFGIKGECHEGRTGVWVKKQTLSLPASPALPLPEGRGIKGEGEFKIAAIGVRIRHWITLHGISINVNPDLSHFDGIVPCGISDKGVTSMRDLGVKAEMAELDAALKRHSSIVLS